MQYLIYSDGGCPGNGRGATEMFGSFAVYDIPQGYSDSLHDELILAEPRHFCHRASIAAVHPHCGATNNVAEASTLHMAITWAVSHGLLVPGNVVHFCMDSEVVLKQFTGRYKTNAPHLRRLYHELYAMLRRHSEAVGVDVEALMHFHHISGETMKKTILGH